MFASNLFKTSCYVLIVFVAISSGCENSSSNLDDIESETETDYPEPDDASSSDPKSTEEPVDTESESESNDPVDTEPEPVDTESEPADTGSEPVDPVDTESETQSETQWETEEPVDTDFYTDTETNTDTETETETETDTNNGVIQSDLIISEYVEGSSDNKAVELHNVSDESIDLSIYSICIYTNDNIQCRSTFELSGTLETNEVVVVCYSDNSSIESCNFYSGAANFNGDDRLELMKNGETIDAFGELMIRPDHAPWQDKTLRRCNPSPYLGQDPFDTLALYTSHPKDDFSNLGIAPSMVECPEAE